MIYLQTVKRFCQEYWKIENYDQAVADTTQVWHCHHRHEIDWALPKEELISIGRYYDVHYSELIFLTPAEHVKLHHKGKEGYWKGKEGPNKGKEGTFKGRHHTEEAKQKISAAKKGQKRTPFSDEHKQKISNSLKGKRSEENNPNYKYHITEEELYDLYIVHRFTRKQIAEKYACHPDTIRNKLHKFNISKKLSTSKSTN